MKRTVVGALLLCSFALSHAMEAYKPLPPGSIKARGWLLEQLCRQRDGLTGHLDEVYPEVMGPTNAWLGGDGDAWERGPYWIDGLLPLAYILDDEVLKAKASTWVEAILSSQSPSGQIGPSRDNPYVYGLQRGRSQDWWPRMVALKILRQYYEATEDERVITCLSRYFRYELERLPLTPLDNWSSWARERGGDNLEVVLWLHGITGEPWLLELASLIHSQTTDWTSLFLEGDFFSHNIHTVNLAQGFKEPVVWWSHSGEKDALEAPKKAIETLRRTCLLPTGLWAGDEQLQFGSPTRGTELCAVVEMMFSLEEILKLSGDLYWANYLERVAYNALPAQVNDDYTAKQYYQQVNQISCTRDWRSFSTPHDGTDTMFGTLNGYPCCLSNMHQGWPKFVQNLWYRTPEGGFAALVYGPSELVTTLPGGIRLRIEESTGYPFRESVEFKIKISGKARKASFPLKFRIPSWSGGAVLTINGEEREIAPGEELVSIDRKWLSGDVVKLDFLAEVSTESWYGGGWTIVRGPLVYALRMEEQWSWKNFEGEDRYFGNGAWEVRSTSAWNYCLMRDRFSAKDCVLEKSEAVPSWPWNAQNAPLRLTVPARELPHWSGVESIAFWTEDGNDTGSDVSITLVPYGCTKLRIAEFPTRIVPWDIELRREKYAHP